MPEEDDTKSTPSSKFPDPSEPKTGRDASGFGLQRGREFGRYLILQQIGAGGMGTVYAAHDPVLDRKVALKVLRQKVTQSDAEQRLLREAQAMARLNHPNVVAVHDAGTHEGRPFVAMEFVEGQDLSSWLREKHRDWREIVAVFADAGEGLAAAHRASLVHRDFKPSNVMIGDDGRVRVTDFGLARAAVGRGWGHFESLTLPPSAYQMEGMEISPLETPLTEDGTVLGTPSFMSPEQALESRADELSDQFSFCVSLYFALFGQHPLGEFSSLPEFVGRLSRGEVQPPPSGHGVPGRVYAAILKGLSTTPAERFGDMTSLLEVLRHDPRRRRQRWILAGLGSVALVLATIGVVQHFTQRRQACLAGDVQMATVWGPERKGELEKHFLEIGGPFGREVMKSVEARLEDYSDDWARVYREACEATRVRGERSEVLLDRQMACLNRGLHVTDHLLAMLAAGDRDLVVSSLDAVMGLQSPEVCADTAALVDRLPLPEDAGLRLRISNVGEGLAAAEADRLAGDYQGCLDRLNDLVPTARELKYPPIIAESLYAKGHIEGALGLAEDAEVSLREALIEAESGRDDRTGAMVANNLMFVAGYLQDDFKDANHWGDFAAAKIARLGGEERLGADLADTRATVLMKAGRYGEAQVVQERALELITQINGPESLDVAMAMTTMGHVLSSIGEYGAAVDYYQRSLELKERLVGPDHPTISFTVASLAQAYGGLGNDEKAVEFARRALTIQEKVFGTEDPQIAIALNNLAYGLEGLGEFDEARAVHERSLEVVSESLGPDHPQLAYTLLNLSSLEKQTGNLEAALAASRRAGDILMAAYGAEHPLYAYAANNMGVFLMLTGRASEGVLYLQKALAIRTTNTSDPVLVSVTRFNLGRALWEASQRERGRQAVRQAEQELEAMGDRAKEDLIAVREWLAEH